MSFFRKPHAWFPLALLLLCAGGAALLAREDATLPLSKDMQYYWARHYWQAALDAISAVCGVGLSTYSLANDFTTIGRWMIAALGASGAVLFLIASVQAFNQVAATDRAPALPAAEGSGALPAAGGSRMAPTVAGSRVFPAAVGRRALPAAGATLVAFFVVQTVGALTVGATRAALAGPLDFAGTVQAGIAAAASTGWLEPAADRREQWALAGVGLLAALGPAVWLLAWPRGRAIAGGAAPILRVTLGYAAFLLAVIAIVAVLEAPRGGAAPLRREAMPETSELARLERSALQALAAAGAGVPTSPLADRAFSDGSKFLFATVILVGGLPGGLTGGMKWPLFALVATTGIRAVFARTRRRGADALRTVGRAEHDAKPPAEADVAAQAAADVATPDAGATRGDRAWSGVARSGDSSARDASVWPRAAIAVVATLALLAVGGALGVLVIESQTASAYQPPPTFADAFLDAASAVGGAGLTTGVFANVTSRNLSRGIRQPTDQYQYGMVWFMLLMLLGRAAPVVVLGRVAASESRAAG